MNITRDIFSWIIKISVFIHYPSLVFPACFSNILAAMNAYTVKNTPHMTVKGMTSGSKFGMAKAATKSAGILRVNIPSDMTLR